MVPLKGPNYATWKIQAKMALIKDALWGIVSGSEVEPSSDAGEDVVRKFQARKDKALAILVLSVDPGLLYLLGDPSDPKQVWECLQNQFQKKSWANRLHLRRQLFACQLREGGKLQDHLKVMTEIFHELAVVGSPVDEEDRVVYLLASLPESYQVLVTALEAHPDVPSWETVTERLLGEERKKMAIVNPSLEAEQGLATSSHQAIECFRCGKPGHIKRNCRVKMSDKIGQRNGKAHKASARTAMKKVEDVGLPAHVSANTWADQNQTWIVDSGATSHMCNDKSVFDRLKTLECPLKITLGDGRGVEATQQGNVQLVMQVGRKSISCTLHDVLWVPDLSFNLFSISKASEKGASATFIGEKCSILGRNKNVVAVARRINGLYHLDHVKRTSRAMVSKKEGNSDLDYQKWHRRLGHLGVGGMTEMIRKEMVLGLDLKKVDSDEGCEPCIQGKIHRSPFPKQSKRRTSEKLELVHSDVCGKMGAISLSGGNYFLTFIDDFTRYVWVYILKQKSEVFSIFKIWKNMVEKQSECHVKSLRTDNGGEFTSNDFEKYLSKEGIRHELTIPHTPEQNGVAERMNRTLVEATRTILVDGGFPLKFWAEAISTSV